MDRNIPAVSNTIKYMILLEIGMVLIAVLLTVVFALLLNPPTRWVNKMNNKKKDA